MSVVVACNLSDGVIMGVDSAITLPAAPPMPGAPLPPNVMIGGVLKTYEDAEKLFPLGERPIGVATFGAAVINTRTVGNYLREFVLKDPGGIVSTPSSIRDVVEQLRIFFYDAYLRLVVPAVEQAHGKKFEDIPDADRPSIGLVVGGFSANEYLSEIWTIVVPVHNAPSSAILTRAQGNFGANWYALYEPITRYIKGYSPNLREILSKVVCGKKAHPRLITAKQLVLVAPLHR
jgi:hypothetical protein